MATIKTYTNDYGFEARAEFATLEEAQAFADSFPKSYLVRTSLYTDDKHNGQESFASCRYSLIPKTGRAVNPVGEQRATRFMDKAEKLGHTIVHVR